MLALGDREAAVTVGKVLASAVANAVHNDGLDAEELFVSACYADEGSTLKRWRPRARGRATRIRKRTSHITIIVSRLPEDRIARRRAKQAGGQDTGAEAWDEEATHADDLVTETEAGPLEESDLDGDNDAGADGVIDVEAVEAVDTEDPVGDTDTGDTDDSDGESAEEKGK